MAAEENPASSSDDCKDEVGVSPLTASMMNAHSAEYAAFTDRAVTSSFIPADA